MSTHISDGDCDCILCERVGTRPRLTLVQGGGEKIPTLREPLNGLATTTWKAMLHLRGQLDGIKGTWGPDTQPIERTWHMVWSEQLDEAIRAFLADNPQLKAGGGER